MALDKSITMKKLFLGFALLLSYVLNAQTDLIMPNKTI